MFSYYICRSLLALVEDSCDVLTEDSDGYQLHSSKEKNKRYYCRESLNRVSEHDCLYDDEQHIEECRDGYDESED